MKSSLMPIRRAAVQFGLNARWKLPAKLYYHTAMGESYYDIALVCLNGFVTIARRSIPLSTMPTIAAHAERMRAIGCNLRSNCRLRKLPTVPCNSVQFCTVFEKWLIENYLFSSEAEGSRTASVGIRR
jgi:hypothetical protein